MLPTTWDPAAFAATHLPEFTTRCAAWASTERAPFSDAVPSPGGGTGPPPI